MIDAVEFLENQKEELIKIYGEGVSNSLMKLIFIEELIIKAKLENDCTYNSSTDFAKALKEFREYLINARKP